MNPYQALANAIVEQAVKDYKSALKKHHKHPDNADCAYEVASLERFFRSGCYELLTDLDGEVLMTGIRRMVRKEAGI